MRAKVVVKHASANEDTLYLPLVKVKNNKTRFIVFPEKLTRVDEQSIAEIFNTVMMRVTTTDYIIAGQAGKTSCLFRIMNHSNFSVMAVKFTEHAVVGDVGKVAATSA